MFFSQFFLKNNFHGIYTINGTLLRRYKHAPDHWSVVRKKNHPVDKALAHFDDFYAQVFSKDQWSKIRPAWFTNQKYVAVINNYGQPEETAAELKLIGAINMRTLFSLERQYIAERRQKNNLDSILKRARESAEIEDPVEATSKSTTNFKQSLHENLKNADIDLRRIIDARTPLSAEIVHEFVPTTQIKGREDFIPESAHYDVFERLTKFRVDVEKSELHFPEHLNIYCFEEWNTSTFAPATVADTGVLNYYIMDGGSILPVIALDIQPGNTVLDVCAAPGGKSLLAIQTLYPAKVVSNDISHSRTNRIFQVYKQFLYDLNEKWLDKNRIEITNSDGRRMINSDKFDRVLVDVPCTTDRHSLKENDNNIFRPSRVKERLKLPELQCELLISALKAVKNGGIVVYSTCTLSPIQNDGVVHMALSKMWEETKLEFVIHDLGASLEQTKSVFKLADPSVMKYGHLVVPDLSQNYGPSYFCKIKRVK